MSEFLKILYKYYGNDGQTAAFVRGLFVAAVDIGTDNDLFPDDSLPQKLYNGSANLSKRVAKKMTPCLNKDKFINYLDALTTDSIIELNTEFVFPDIYDPGDMTAVCSTLYGKLYDIFVSYIDNAGKNYSWTSSAKNQLTIDGYSMVAGDEIGVFGLPTLPSGANTVLSLLVEVSGKCPLCKKSLLRDKGDSGVGAYQIAEIYPTKPTEKTALELAGVKKLSDNLDTAYNKIALCTDCARNYATDTVKAEYVKLYALKKELLMFNSAQNKVDDARIEQEIEDVVRVIVAADPKDFAELSYEAASIAEKIPMTNAMFFRKVFRNVVEYFDCVKLRSTS
ncbi:hypothetical protein FACS1894208_08660 [Clostridia bacterium]|nr:hypothetical protein FACS1894208_08660 [Clostridia bacterium]